MLRLLIILLLIAPAHAHDSGQWADTVLTEDGKIVAVITDDRPDEPLNRRHVPVGTRIVVPPHKIKWDRGNPTGHVIIFLSVANEVYCFVQNGGV